MYIHTVKHLAITCEETVPWKMTVAEEFYGCQIYRDRNKLIAHMENNT